ncbi:hypothetical protein NYQ25_18500 [Curtobacterium flaccumfaciens pv. flaccumfaciens]|uniref:hypothetical protein n=1 Tax=Curtobacterium flaccumfaciens TaxID=2035 RepID=UPI00217E2CFC|nr:hypothetical protein [Curtobacterium flaccumfaciens]MCS6586963.1 hypothetical protein [Curtobacterium flaccumfaciens pv. flaccumfaciens]
MNIPRATRLRGHVALAVVIVLGVSLSGCAQEKVDPLEVTNSATITDITDNTGTGFYTVDSAVLNTTSLGTELTLGFTILNSNGIKFSPISTITFDDGTELTCEADDLRRVPSLVDTTDSWDFACDAGEFPDDSASAALVVVDDYN